MEKLTFVTNWLHNHVARSDKRNHNRSTQLRQQAERIELFLLRHYPPLRTLASSTIFLHSCPSLATACQFLTPFTFKSSSNSTVHLFRGLLLINSSIQAVITFSGILTLTLILLTWRIWRAPNNASKWHMRFNSAFKGLIRVSIYGIQRFIAAVFTNAYH